MMAERRRRPGYWERVVQALRLLVGLTDEIVRLLDAIRNIH